MWQGQMHLVRMSCASVMGAILMGVTDVVIKQ
jgi:hypothetical protein